MLICESTYDDLLAALIRERKLRQVLFDALCEGVLILDQNGRICEANPSAAFLMHIALADLPGKLLHEVCRFKDERTQAVIEDPIQYSLTRTPRERVHDSNSFMTLEANNGTEVTIQLIACALDAPPGETVVILQDVTTNRNLSRQLQWQAHHDPITGLVNRLHFEESLAHALQKSITKTVPSVLAQIDIDHFKLINDTCGNIAGDQLLGQLAILFQEQIRSRDLLARLGGDEFGILFRQCTMPQAQQIVNQLQEALHNFRYVWKGKSLTIEMSIGLVPLDVDTIDVETALSQADTACYTAKNRGKSRIQVFSSRDVAVEDLKRHQEWSLLIRDAIEEERFALYRQPIVEIDQRETIPHHYEVLLRMINTSGEMVAPDRFIPTAERYHLMPLVDRWVVDHCLRHLEQMMAQNQLNSSIVHSINLSGDSLNDDQFLGELMARVAECLVPPQQICFEITETAAIANLRQVNDFMRSLKKMGCLFSLDDFGAGMSSFGYLSALPVDFVKIDGKFVQDIELDPSNATIVESIVHVSKSLGLKTIAERVEHESIAYRLQTLGVDLIQGFGVGRPARWF